MQERPASICNVLLKKLYRFKNSISQLEKSELLVTEKKKNVFLSLALKQIFAVLVKKKASIKFKAVICCFFYRMHWGAPKQSLWLEWDYENESRDFV